MAEFLSIASAVLILITGIMYFMQIQRGLSQPNAATWIIWLFIDAVNLASYAKMVEQEPFKAYVAIAATINALGIVTYAAWNRSFVRMDRTDLFLLLLAMVITLIWNLTGNATLANVLLQSVYVISFALTIRSICNGAPEHPAAWLVAVCAYVLSIIAIIFTWDSPDDGWELAFPIINGVLGNGSIPVTLWIVRRRQQ